MIHRDIQERLKRQFTEGKKITTLRGPRRVGKTTLVQWLEGEVEGRKLVLNGDFLDDRRLLSPERATLDNLVKSVDWLFIDEAQNFEHIGACLKILHDHAPQVRVLATGSSSFDMAQKLGEPLTGRQVELLLFPLAYQELGPKVTTRSSLLAQMLVYGSYPEAWTSESHGDRVNYLKQLVADYLLKDIFAQVEVNRQKLGDILRLLALQIGAEVSLSEIGRQIQMDVKTVARYVHFLEEAFVIVRLRGFSRNLRKEIAKSQKIYFVDLGIRNAILQAFQPMELRQDSGLLWENLMVLERMKFCFNRNRSPNFYFWRTYDQQELDLIEEEDGQLRAFQFKYGNGKVKIPKLWQSTYPDSEVQIVRPENVDGFLVD